MPYIPRPPFMASPPGNCKHDFINVPMGFNLEDVSKFYNEKYMVILQVCVKCKFAYRKVNFDYSFEDVKLFYKMERMRKHAYNI